MAWNQPDQQVHTLWCWAAAIVALLCTGVFAVDDGQQQPQQQFTSSDEWEAAMYVHGANHACVRLLNATSVVGCAAPEGASEVRGQLTPASAAGVSEPSSAVFVVGSEGLATMVGLVLSNNTLRARTAGVLVKAGRPDSFSPAPCDPGQGSAASIPEGQQQQQQHKEKGGGGGDVDWNPGGTGLARLCIPFPIFQLDEAMSPLAEARARDNHERAFKGRQHMAAMRLDMRGSHNSSHCLPQKPGGPPKRCDPLGAHSVIAAMPPLPVVGGGGAAAGAGGGKRAKGKGGGRRVPLVLVVAGVDSDALFHDLAKGADDPLSGLIAMLAAMDVLRNSSDISRTMSHAGDDGADGADALGADGGGVLKRHLMFAALAGEPWGNMGSKRLLWESHLGTNATRGLGLDAIERVLEIGPVGRAATGGGAAQLFVHSPPKGQGYAPAGPLEEVLTQAVRACGKGVVSAERATAKALPPSSLASFLRANGSIPVALLAEYDTRYINPYFHSQYDDEEGGGLDLGAVASAAELLARALMVLATDGGRSAESLEVDRPALRGVVEGLADCLLRTDPGLGCWLARGAFPPDGGPPPPPLNHYVGVMQSLASDDQDPLPGVKKPMELFLWSYMAERAVARAAAAPPGVGQQQQQQEWVEAVQGGWVEIQGGLPPPPPCDFRAAKCPDGSVCMGHRYLAGGKQQLGQCRRGTVRFVPSYSTSFEPGTCRGALCWNFTLTAHAASWEASGGWPRDGMWTESLWPLGQPWVMVYLREDPGRDTLALAAGVGVTLLASAVAFAASQALEWQKKVQ